MSARSKACNIPVKVKQAVVERDKTLCVICGRMGIPNCHYLARSAGGLGIEENIVCTCIECHHDYDNGFKHKEYKVKIREYLQKQYPDWNESKLIYNKWEV